MQKTRKHENEDYLKIVSDGVKNMTTVDHMTEERIVPTIFTGYNRAIGVGGQPLGCVMLVQGPNQVGKSVFAMAIAESLRRFGHTSFIWDGEHAGEKKWLSAITPKSGYKRTSDLDVLIGDVQRMHRNLMKAREKKKIPKNVGNVYVFDTLTEFLPGDVLEIIRKEGPKKMFAVQAYYLSLWLKSVVEELDQSNSLIIAVIQEREKHDKKGNWDVDYKPAGGRAIQYGNRVRVRVRSVRKIKDGDDVVGMRCTYAIENNKIVGTTFATSHFFTSNGEGDVPLGLDLVREAIEEARERGVLVKRSRGNSVVAKFDKSILFEVDGGWEDVRLRLMGDSGLFDKFVDALNAEVAG